MNAHRERSFFLPRRGKQMQEQDNTFSADLSRRGVLMGAAAGGLVIAGGGAMLAPSANAATAKIKNKDTEEIRKIILEPFANYLCMSCLYYNLP